MFKKMELIVNPFTIRNKLTYASIYFEHLDATKYVTETVHV